MLNKARAGIIEWAAKDILQKFTLFKGVLSALIALQVKGLSKSFGAEEIFSDVSFVLEVGEKAGLVGPNGAGKTTLLRCVTGEETPDAGEVTEALELGYLEQIPQYPPGTTLFEAVLEVFADLISLRGQLRELEQAMGEEPERLERTMQAYAEVTEQYERSGGFSCESMVRRITAGLGFNEADLAREINTFSGGEKTRAGLARLLAREPEILLLDEPTNHLDLEGIEWLEGYLKGYRGSMLLISHDRYFLDQVTGKTLELDHGSLERFSGNYSRYLVLKAEKDAAQAKAYEKQQKEIRTTEEYIDKYRAGIKSKQARGRQSQLDRLERLKAPETSGVIKLKGGGQQVTGSGNIVLEVSELSFGFAGKQLLDQVSFQLQQGEKVSLVGRNGVGKSTLLKLIKGELAPQAGQVRLGSRVQPGYYDQEHAGLDDRNRVIGELTANFAMGETEARDYLGAFLFQGDDVFKPVRDLSGGEKGRLSFLKLFLSRPNFLILDEPTNHLDIVSRGIIEEYLRGFPGTILSVSHDRYFLDKVTGRTLELEQAAIHNYLGNYTYYREHVRARELQELSEPQAKDRPSPAAGAKVQERPKLNKAKTRTQIASLEQNIEVMEARLGELTGLLADPVTYQDEAEAKNLVQEYKLLEEQIPEIYAEWEKLTDLLANS